MRHWFSRATRADRLRATGWCVLAVGLAGAAAFYWVKTATADPILDDITALGYSRSLQHGIGVMMGQSGVILATWQQDLTSPLGLAVLIAIGTALVAGYFFRVAWVLDAEDEEPIA